MLIETPESGGPDLESGRWVLVIGVRLTAALTAQGHVDESRSGFDVDDVNSQLCSEPQSPGWPAPGSNLDSIDAW